MKVVVLKSKLSNILLYCVLDFSYHAIDKYKVILVMFSLVFNCLKRTNGCFLYPRMCPLYLNTLYLHQEWVLSTEAAMFFFYSSPN